MQRRDRAVHQGRLPTRCGTAGRALLALIKWACLSDEGGAREHYVLGEAEAAERARSLETVFGSLVAVYGAADPRSSCSIDEI